MIKTIPINRAKYFFSHFTPEIGNINDLTVSEKCLAAAFEKKKVNRMNNKNNFSSTPKTSFFIITIQVRAYYMLMLLVLFLLIPFISSFL